MSDLTVGAITARPISSVTPAVQPAAPAPVAPSAPSVTLPLQSPIDIPAALSLQGPYIIRQTMLLDGMRALEQLIRTVDRARATASTVAPGSGSAKIDVRA